MPELQTAIGLGSLAEIATIALYDGNRIKYYINGKNLGDFPTDIKQYKIIVSFNGKTFDVPVIESYFGITGLRAFKHPIPR